MDVSEVAVKPIKDFARSSIRLVKKCTKPDRKGGSPPGRAIARRGVHAALIGCDIRSY